MWRRVLSLYLPWLATDLYRRQRECREFRDFRGFQGRCDRHERLGPILLVDAVHGTQMVARCCARSAAGGIRTGMALSHARALLPADGVVVLPFDPEREARALSGLARWALRFTPVVAVDPPDGLLLDLTGCERLYRGPRRMLQQIMQAVDALHVQGRAAMAPTIGCAWALARFGQLRLMITSDDEVRHALAPLPVESLRLSPAAVQRLHSVGVVRVEHLLALPRASLAMRFGSDPPELPPEVSPELPRRLDQALGRMYECVDPVQPSEPIQVERAFAGAVTQLEAVLLCVEQLVGEMSAQLHCRQEGVRRVVLKACRLDGPPVEHAVMLSRPSRSARHIWALLRPIVENLHMGYGIERLTLTATQTRRQPQQQMACVDWLQDAAQDIDDGHMGELIDVLGARLGRERVLKARMVETYSPERAYAMAPADNGEEPSHSSVAVVDADRPSWLYDRPEPVQVVLMSPEGPVVSMTRRGAVHVIRTTIGPERITPRWWLGVWIARPRDYYKLQDETGCWWWVYRHVDTARWFIHGQWV